MAIPSLSPRHPIAQGGRKFLVGDKFSIADAYTYIILSWSGYLKVKARGGNYHGVLDRIRFGRYHCSCAFF